jgi:hypothetical protein
LPTIGSRRAVTPDGCRQRATVAGWLRALQTLQAGGPPA